MIRDYTWDFEEYFYMNNLYSYSLDYEKEPVLYVNPQESFEANVLNAFNGSFSNEEELTETIKKGFHHPAFGPVYVNGATKHSSLKISIKDIIPQNVAYQCLSKSTGFCKFDTSKGRRLKILKYDGDIIYDGFRMPASPSLGMIGLACKNKTRTGRVDYSGGNIDISEIKKGTTIILPSSYDGGLLYLGDLHLMQNNGEISGIAAETSGSVIISVEITKKQFNFPVIQNKSGITVLGFGNSIKEAGSSACNNAVEYFAMNLDIDKVDAYMFLGIWGELLVGHATGKVVSCGIKVKSEYLKKRGIKV